MGREWKTKKKKKKKKKEEEGEGGGCWNICCVFPWLNNMNSRGSVEFDGVYLCPMLGAHS